MKIHSKRVRPVIIGMVTIFAFSLLFGASRVSAQEQVAYQPSGFSAFEQFSGSETSQGQLMIQDTDLGYNFNEHVGLDIGVPVWEVHETFPGQPHRWNTGIGDPYADLRLTFLNPYLNYSTVATVAVPAEETGAFSTGRLGLDWFNHFDHSFGRLTPFADGGISNGIIDTRLLSQPFRLVQSFRTLGFLADVEGGMGFRVANRMSIGGSYYALLPSGSQKAFNGITNFFLTPAATVGNNTLSNITHDRGYSAWIRVSPASFFYIEPAYVHSLKLNDDAVTLTVGVDVRKMFTRGSSN